MRASPPSFRPGLRLHLKLRHELLEVLTATERVEGRLDSVGVGVDVAGSHSLAEQAHGPVRLGPTLLGRHARARLVAEFRQASVAAGPKKRIAAARNLQPLVERDGPSPGRGGSGQVFRVALQLPDS